MAVGLPVVVTDTGGAADTVKNGETGFVVETGNEEELEKKIRQLCESDEQRVRMGKSAREWVVDHHSWKYIMKYLDKIYNQCPIRAGYQT
jgi:glycosyltransferase involved in cell wall biosynthesis